MARGGAPRSTRTPLDGLRVALLPGFTPHERGVSQLSEIGVDRAEAKAHVLGKLHHALERSVSFGSEGHLLEERDDLLLYAYCLGWCCNLIDLVVTDKDAWELCTVDKKYLPVVWRSWSGYLVA